MFLQISQNPQANTCAMVSPFWHKCFIVNFAEPLITTFLKKHSDGCFCKNTRSVPLGPWKFCKFLRSAYNNFAVRLKNVLNTNLMIRLENVLKISWRHFSKTSSGCFKDVFKTFCHGVLKISSRLLQNAFKMSLQDVFARRLEDVLKRNIIVLIKTS